LRMAPNCTSAYPLCQHMHVMGWPSPFIC